MLGRSIVALIEWKPSYSVGVPTFDRQHQKLFELINQLHEAMAKGKARDQMAPIVDALSNYTKTHFREEEEALARAGYTKLPSHKLMHREFEAKVDGFGKDVKAGKLGLSIEVMSFLNDWLAAHIMKVDREYDPLLAPTPALAAR